jgi:hypothetical protein
MSSISSIGSSLASYLQQLRANQSAGSVSAASNTSSASNVSSSSTTSAPPNLDSQIRSALTAQGVSGSALSTLRSSIENTIGQAATGGSSGPDDGKAAVDNVVKAAGLDTTKFDAAVGGHHHGHGRHGGVPAAGGSNDSSGSALDSVLTEAGIDPTSFKSSLSQLISSGNTSSSAVAALFSGAATGSDVDVYG